MVKRKQSGEHVKVRQPPAATPYVKRRLAELAAEHGWDQKHVEAVVVPPESAEDDEAKNRRQG